jgi:hypothetical protein
LFPGTFSRFALVVLAHPALQISEVGVVVVELLGADALAVLGELQPQRLLVLDDTMVEIPDHAGDLIGASHAVVLHLVSADLHPLSAVALAGLDARARALKHVHGLTDPGEVILVQAVLLPQPHELVRGDRVVGHAEEGDPAEEHLLADRAFTYCHQFRGHSLFLRLSSGVQSSSWETTRCAVLSSSPMSRSRRAIVGPGTPSRTSAATFMTHHPPS